jgi:hypothetical protein
MTGYCEISNESQLTPSYSDEGCLASFDNVPVTNDFSRMFKIAILPLPAA